MVCTGSGDSNLRPSRRGSVAWRPLDQKTLVRPLDRVTLALCAGDDQGYVRIWGVQLDEAPGRRATLLGVCDWSCSPGVPLGDPVLEHEAKRRKAHQHSAVSACAWSPRGDLLATAGDKDDQLLVWDMHQFRLQGRACNKVDLYPRLWLLCGPSNDLKACGKGHEGSDGMQFRSLASAGTTPAASWLLAVGKEIGRAEPNGRALVCAASAQI